jgi:hypothetical protein
MLVGTARIAPQKLSNQLVSEDKATELSVRL